MSLHPMETLILLSGIMTDDSLNNTFPTLSHAFESNPAWNGDSVTLLR